jgi:hypothetical protein
MSKKHIIAFIILVVLSLISLAGSLITENVVGIGFSITLIGVLVFSIAVASEYAITYEYHKKAFPILEEQIKLLEELRENHEDQIKTLTDMYHDATQQRLNYLASLISFEAAFQEFLKENNPHAVKYANRWLNKSKEIQKLVDESYNKESLDNWFEISDGLFKYRDQIHSGEIDIDRTIE